MKQTKADKDFIPFLSVASRKTVLPTHKVGKQASEISCQSNIIARVENEVQEQVNVSIILFIF